MPGNRASEAQTAGGDLSLDRLLSAVRRRIGLVVALPMLVSVLTFAYVSLLPDRYDAFAVVQIDPRKKSISNLDSVISELKADNATVESEVEILTSRAIALKVISLLGLRHDAEFVATGGPLWQVRDFFAGLLPAARHAEPALVAEHAGEAPAPAPNVNNDPLSGYLGPHRPGETRPERDEIAAIFAERLRVARIRNTLLIEIRFSAADAVTAARVANTIAEVYLAEQLATKQDVAAHASRLLEQKLESMRAQLNEQERRVAAYKAKNNIIETEGQILGEKQLARLMEQGVIARNTTAEARAKYELAQRLVAKGDDGSGIADVLQSHTIRLLKEQLAKATGREAELATRYGGKHPEMVKVRAEVSEAQGQLDAEIARLVANLRNEYTIAERRERDLTEALDQLKSDETVSKEAGVDLKELVREAEATRALYEALLIRYRQTVETQSLQLPDARIVEQADTPLGPAAPKRAQIIAIATFLALAFAIAIALLAEFMTLGIGRPEDVERVFELAHLASLPAAAAEADDQMRAVRLMIAEPAGAFAEAIRALRREIDVRRPDDRPRVVLVASSLPNDGASLVASNLAHHYATTGARVILIDGDLRRAPLTRRLAASRRAGLAEVLTRGAAPDDAILFDATTGLHFMPACGPAPSKASPPELLASAEMGRLLTALRAEFDVIVIDTPPLLPVLDGRILADDADQIVFVMAWRQTPKKLARRALASLGFNQSKLVGVVVNAVDEAILADQSGGGRRGAGGLVRQLRGDLERAA